MNFFRMSAPEKANTMERLDLFDMADEDTRDLIAADFFRETGIDIHQTRAPHLHEELLIAA